MEISGRYYTLTAPGEHQRQSQVETPAHFTTSTSQRWTHNDHKPIGYRKR